MRKREIIVARTLRVRARTWLRLSTLLVAALLLEATSLPAQFLDHQANRITISDAQESDPTGDAHADDHRFFGPVSHVIQPRALVINGRLPCVVTDTTTYGGGLTSFSDLELFQSVEVVATRAAGQTVFTVVDIRQRDVDGSFGDDLLRFSSRGLVEQLLPDDRFKLDDGRVYDVVEQTRWGGDLSGFSDLETGVFLSIMAVRTPNGHFVAEFINNRDLEPDDRTYRTIVGIFKTSSPHHIELVDGTLARLIPETHFTGDCDRRLDLQPGWQVEIVGIPSPDGRLTAISVRGNDREAPTIMGHDFEPFEALVVTSDDVDISQLATDLDARIAAEIHGVALLLRWPYQLDDELLASVAAYPGVTAVEPNYLFRDPESVRRRYPIIDLSPIMPDWDLQEAVLQIQLSKAQLSSVGSGVLVALIDNGVDPTHPFLAGRLTPGGMDLVDGDNQPWETALGVDDDGDGDIDEALGHGTFVASVVALVAPAATILPYRVLDDDGGGTAFNLALALADAIARDVDVINMSLSYHRRSEVVDALIEQAAASGIVVVAASGNDDSEGIPFPASDSNTIGVTALSKDGLSLWPAANRSSAIVIAAPGEEIYGALPNQLYGTWEGTSFASPFVTGVAALLRSLDPELDAELIEQAIIQGGQTFIDGDWTGVTLDAGGAVELIASGR